MLGFLSPQGEFRECDYRGHGKLAHAIINDDALYPYEAEEKLKKQGWIVLSDGYALLDRSDINYITDQQIKWYRENKSKLNEDYVRGFECLIMLKQIKNDKRQKLIDMTGKSDMTFLEPSAYDEALIGYKLNEDLEPIPVYSQTDVILITMSLYNMSHEQASDDFHYNQSYRVGNYNPEFIITLDSEI